MKQLEVMNFLNEVSDRFPAAYSLASGRPDARFFKSIDLPRLQQQFIHYFADKTGRSFAESQELLLQYGPSAGIINDILAQHLLADEHILTSPEDIIVTNGCQEALTLICLNELSKPEDCMLTLDPSYIGLSGFIQSIGKHIEPISIGEHVLHDSIAFKANLEVEILNTLKKGYQPKAIYVNGDFNNPLGFSLSELHKKALIDVCSTFKIKIIEDNPYGMFNYEGQCAATIKSLDEQGCVYYIGSFAKTVLPALRVGYLVLPARKIDEVAQLVALKSLISVNTSQICQAVIGGHLLEQEFSLERSIQPVRDVYKSKRDALVSALEHYLGGMSQVKWTIPAGGFFLVVSVPFNVTDEDVFRCAELYGVIFTPVYFFSLAEHTNKRLIRLAFSNLCEAKINDAVCKLSEFIEFKIGENIR
ncbi:aminotransferase-like domain-containing protein [Pseudoalteromonas rhizosphaerae]|uniref:PLP-dependent aminotransferase family protein n=1 Tax=Pseudoalteromonas rhizosphaerae TaxID=2518973 RepID=A0ABW8L1C1_9GAMM